MLYNNPNAPEMQRDEAGNYLGSGSPYFYALKNGANGMPIPAYPIRGAYMQIRLVITTLNPMSA
jgi:hypothetical protein